MIDINSETTLLLSAVPDHHSLRREPRLHPSTIQRWVRRGVLAPDGSRVKLEAVRLGGRWYTSIEALQRYATRLSGGAVQPGPQGVAAASKAAHANDALERLGY